MKRSKSTKDPAALPYRPTGAQGRAMAEIAEDMASDRRMNRLLQGDVAAPPFEPGSFDHVAMNPPYLARGRATAPTERPKTAASAR